MYRALNSELIPAFRYTFSNLQRKMSFEENIFKGLLG